MMATIVLKVTLLLMLGWTLTRVLRQRSAATRHFVWCVALAGCVAVAGVEALAPRLEVKVPRGAAFEAAAPAASLRAGWKPAERPAGSRRSATPGSVDRTELPSLPTLWGLGVAATLAWSLIGHLALAWVARKARTIDTIDGVSVRSTDRISAPVTCGWRTPVILLPVEAEAWPEERLRAALEHELAHIARRDFFTQAAARLVAALYWFHPLAWLALARLRAESEHACDDRVLSGGMTAADYAAHLLAVAQGALARRHGAVFGVAMARPSELESRLIAVLDDTRSRGLLSRRTGVAAAMLVAVVLLPIAAAKEKAEKAEKSVKADTAKQRADRPSSVVNHSIPASPGETLTLDLPTGAGIDMAAWDEPSVHVQVEFRGNDAANTTVGVARDGKGVRVTSEYVGRNEVQSSSLFLTIHAPRRFNLDVHSAGGTIELDGLEGTFRGTTGGGEMTLSNLRGTAKLSSGGGAITVTDSQLDGDVSTGGGRISILRVRGNLRGSSGSGPVVYSEDKDESGHGLRVHKPGGPIEIGRVEGSVDASTGGGDVSIGPVSGGVHASTGGGDVHIDVENLEGVEPIVDVTTGSGTVVIELPANVDARFELETAYTENFRRATRIESDWNVEQRTSPTWDDQEGTPRRYVRARGTAGSGRGLVRIKAINGDVVVKKR